MSEAIRILKKKKCKYICTLTNVKEKKTIEWFSNRGIKGNFKFLWSDMVLSKDFLDSEVRG